MFILQNSVQIKLKYDIYYFQDNLWWDAFATEFFEDDATLTLTFCLEDGPKRYSKFYILSLKYNRFTFCLNFRFLGRCYDQFIFLHYSCTTNSQFSLARKWCSLLFSALGIFNSIHLLIGIVKIFKFVLYVNNFRLSTLWFADSMVI